MVPIQHLAAHFGLDSHTGKAIGHRRLEREVGTLDDVYFIRTIN